jgi:SAM-dependent methyltransferase
MVSRSMPSRPTPAAGAKEPAPAPPGDVRFWDRFARRYAAAAIGDPQGYEATIRRVRSLLEPEDSVLEIGCGTGTTALRLADRTRRLLATDGSSAMIAIAREKLAAQPVPQLRFEVADADAVPHGDEPLDVVLAFNVLHLVPDLDRTLRALRPALRPGGLFVSKTPCLGEMNPLVPRLVVPLLRWLRLAPPVASFDAAHLRAAFERQGFAVEGVERHGSRRKDIRAFIVARRVD